MIQPFNVIFYKGNSFIGKLIRKFTKGRYSHCALVLSDSFHVLQLDYKTPLSIQHLNYKSSDYDVYELTFDLSNKEKEQITTYIIERLSTTYDWKYICSRFFNILFGTKIYNSKNNYNCDELILDAFRSIGVNLLNGDDQVSPETLSKSKYLRKINKGVNT